MRGIPQLSGDIATDLRQVDIHRHLGHDASGYNCRLEQRLFDVKPDTTAKRPLFQRSAQHLLTGCSQKVGMPYNQNTNANMSLRGSE